MRSFEVPIADDSLDISTEPCAFIENDRVAVLASGAGVVKLVAVKTGALIHELRHGYGSGSDPTVVIELTIVFRHYRYTGTCGLAI